MVKKEYYEVLKISEDASKSDIRKAYIDLARSTHPDKGGNEEAFKKINKAYEVLIDENKRRTYDNGGNVSVEIYGYDYGEEIEKGELAVKKYTDHISAMNEAWNNLHYFSADTDGYRTKKQMIVSDYHLIRAKNLLKLLNSYYKPKYLAAKNEMERRDLVEHFQFWFNNSGRSNETAWNSNFERIKRMLNFARNFLGLSELTDQDLQIEGKSPNETPQIPDNNNNPKPIKDGVANIDEHNNLYYRKNHETIREYYRLRGVIYNTSASWEKYKAVNSTLLNEIDSKEFEIDKGNFREIFANDNDTKIGEIKKFNESRLAKMKETIKLMEKIIEEGKNYKPTVENNQSESKKRKATDEFEARQEVAKKSKTINDELSRLIKEARGLSNYGELESKIKEIDKYQGEEDYNNQYREEINQLKINLANLDKDKYRQGIIKKIENELSESGLKESDLDQENKNALAKIRSGEINDINKINEIENKITAKTGEKKSTDSLNNWLEQAKKLVDGIIKGSADYLEKELKKIKQGLYDFKFSSNVYQNNVYRSKEKDVSFMLNKLENFSVQSNTNQSAGGFFQPKVIIPVAITAAVVLTVATLVIIRNKRYKKVK